MLSKYRFLVLVKQMFLFSLLAFFAIALYATPCQAGAGDLDPTFGDGGIILTDIVSQSKFARLQIPFVKNSGQVSSDVAFYASTADSTLFITQSGEQVIRLPVPESSSVLAIREKFIAATNTTAVGLDPAKTKINYFKGNDPKSWRENLTSWQKIGIHNVYPGIDYQLRPMSQQAEKIFIVNPEADPKIIRLAIEGIDNLSISSDGSLTLHNTAGDLEYSPPVAYQEIGEQRIPVKVSYLVDGKTYGFKVAEYDRKHALIIDPLVRTSFFGGSAGESGSGIAVNQTTGSVYITGYVSSTDLPTTAGVFKENKAETDFQDIYVAKFNATLTTLEAATYYGSNGWEFGASAIALHPDGSVYLAGKTQGTDLPGASTGYQSAYTGGTYGDAFIARLNEDLTGPPQATYLGGTGEETGISIAVNSYPDHDLYGSVYVAGRTNSTDFPGTTGGFLETNQGSTDVFIAYFDAALQTLGQATYFGGTGWEEPATDARGQALLVHPGNGDIMLVGWTSSSTITSLMFGRNGTSDAFYARLFSTLDGAQTGTYIGGNDQDMASAMAIMPLEGSTDVDVFVVGRTKSTTDLVDPAHEGFYTTYQGGNFDAFVVGLRNVVKTYSTYLGGESDDRGYGIIVNPVDKRVWVTGETLSTDFPAAVDQADNAGYIDAFVSALSLDLGSLDYSSYLGGTNGDYGTAMAIHESSRRLYVVGNTSSADLHGTGVQSYDSSYNESGDAFVALFDELNINPPPALWVTQDIGPGKGPDLGADDEGNLYACYFQGDQMHIKKRSPVGIWTITGSFDLPEGDLGFLDCSIAVEANGRVHTCIVTDTQDITDVNNDLWYIGPAVSAEAVDSSEPENIGADSECAIAVNEGMPTISFRMKSSADGAFENAALAVAVKPRPDEPWIVMTDIYRPNNDIIFAPTANYGKHTALAFGSTGLPVVGFTDVDGTASFFIPDDYPPLTPATADAIEWTRYASSHPGKVFHLNWYDTLVVGTTFIERFRLHGQKYPGAVTTHSAEFEKNGTILDNWSISEFPIFMPEISSSPVSDSASHCAKTQPEISSMPGRRRLRQVFSAYRRCDGHLDALSGNHLHSRLTLKNGAHST